MATANDKIIYGDFKKWIIYNNTLNQPENFYMLYQCVSSRKDQDKITIGERVENDELTYHLKQEGFPFALEITDSERKQLLQYLDQHYLSGKDIEEWFANKSNHTSDDEQIETVSRDNYRSADEIKPSPQEVRYYKISLITSLLVYSILFFALVASFFDSITFGLGMIFFAAVVGVVLFILKRVIVGMFLGNLKGNSVRINEEQFPELFEIVKFQVQTLQLKEIPHIYLVHGQLNAFVIKMARKKYLTLFSETVETSLKGDKEALKFIIGHELGHLQRKHLSQNLLLLPALTIPLLRQAYSRGCEYTCDRYGYHFSAKGAFDGLLMLTTSKELYKKVVIDKMIEAAEDENSFWLWLSEKFFSHPHLVNRLKILKRYSEKGY
jgi:Zn-dependent protease with chaperone function